MITDSALQAVSVATDKSVLVEFYDVDQAPSDDGFDPADALKLFALTAGITFAGEAYTRKIRSIGSVRRTTAEESDSAQVTLDNLDREVSQFEFATGFEGLIMVVRLISRSLSTKLDESIYLFTGRCEKPTSGSRESVSVTAKGILHSTKAELPRRKFQKDDPDGRLPSDHDYQGFPYMPQVNAGTTVYSARLKRGGLLGLLGFKKTRTKTLVYSSFSDLDAEKYLPVALGRVQVVGTHLGYADVGTSVRMATAFMEGAIEYFDSYRTDDVRFSITGTVHKRFGYPPDLGPTPYEQIPVPTTSWIANGYYARTAMFFCEAAGTSIDQVDPAPHIIIIALGLRVPVPISGTWTTVDTWHADAKWSDNPAAHVRYLLTSPDYYNLDDNWMDDATFIESYDHNDQYFFDESFTDIIFTPDNANFTGGYTELNRFLLSTGVATPEWFEYLNDDKTAAETFLKTAFSEPYSGSIPGSVASPGDPTDPPDLPGGGSVSLGYYLRRRYTSNIVFTEQIKLVDALHDVLFVSARLYMSQNPRNGRLRLKNKKPADFGLGTAAISTTSCAIDDVSAWIGDLHGYVVLDPNTANSEAREVTAAAYSTAQNSVTLTASEDTVVGFSGCDGASTPATATVTIITPTPLTAKTVTLDGIDISFRPGAIDTEATCAGFLYAAINAHPMLKRRFVADWTPGGAVVTITGKFGTLTLDSAPALSHVAPLGNPGSGPSVSAPTATGSLDPGVYHVGYTEYTARGETIISPLSTITISGSNKRISVAAVTPSGGATGINWYCSPGPGSFKLRRYKTNDGSAHTIDLADLPLQTSQIKPDLNRTGTEVLRVEALVTDRSLARSGTQRANALIGSFRWKLGDQAKAVNRVDFKFRDSTQDFRLVELRLRDDAHIAKIKKINNVEVNGQAVDNWNQAYRLAAGMLAEYRDADFFYEWESDNEALLLEEGDVVAITDDGAEVFNLPVRIESIEYQNTDGFVKAVFRARLYTSTLYDDSVAERNIPVVIDASETTDFV